MYAIFKKWKVAPLQLFPEVKHYLLLSCVFLVRTPNFSML